MMQANGVIRLNADAISAPNDATIAQGDTISPPCVYLSTTLSIWTSYCKEDRRRRENLPPADIEPGTYALTWSFSHQAYPTQW